MTALLRLSALRERIRSSLWFLPAVSVVVSLAVAIALAEIERRTQVGGSVIGFAGSPEGARAVLATVAGSTITVTGLTFSLTVVALQVAASQFTPRLLSSFLSDRGNQVVLSTFLSTFVYSLAVLRSIRSPAEGTTFVPHIAVAVGMALTLVSIAMLVYFFDHLTQQLRVETILRDLQRETLELIRRQAPTDGATLPEDLELPEVPDHAVAIRARRSGHLQALHLGVLGDVADDHGIVIRLRPSVGVHVTEATTLAWVWPVDDADGERELDAEVLSSGVHRGIHLGHERTMQHDVAFGIRQLVDICARALSPGVNDPTTAVTTIASTASVLTELARTGRAPATRSDDLGRLRVAVPQSTFSELLALACDQPRRYGASEPAVLVEILRLLTDVAEVAPEQHSETIARQIERTQAAADGADLADEDRARVRAAARHATTALRGDARVARVRDEDDAEAVAD